MGKTHGHRAPIPASDDRPAPGAPPTDMLTLTRAVHDEIVDHSLAGSPREVCGVLGGDRGDPSHASVVRRAENVADAPRAQYAIDPAEQLDLMTAIEDEGAAVVGFYHSHPAGPPRPSATDAARATWPDRSYVVVALGGGEPRVRSWRWTGERFEREALEVR